MQRRKTDIRTILIVAWTLLGGYELHTWLAGDQFPPGPIMSLAHIGLATLTVLYVITRNAASTQDNIQLGRDIERATGGTSRGGLRSVEEATR